MIPIHELTGMVLAGGEGRRMGGRDKGLEPFAGLPLVGHVVKRLQGQVGELLINANRNADAYRFFADRVIADRVMDGAESGFNGPLMGIYSGLCEANTPWLLVAPCDSPALPDDLVKRMVEGINADSGQYDIAVAYDGERLHPVVALLRTSLADDLANALAEGERKIDRWYDRHAWCRVDMSDCPDAFANLNTEEDKLRLETSLMATVGKEIK